MIAITVKQLAAAKRIAMNVLPLTSKKAKLQAKITEMERDIENLNRQIDIHQSYIKNLTGGLTTEQLLIRNEKRAFEANPEILDWDKDSHVWFIKRNNINVESTDTTFSEEDNA